MSQFNYRDPNTDEFKNIYVKVSDTLPVGSICQYGGTVVPSGYLMCDGKAISRTEYSDLFKKIGTSFGAGDGLTTFNVPNFNGKVPIGLDGTHTAYDTIGKVGGGTAASGTDVTLKNYLVTNFIIKASKKVAIDKGNVVDSLTGEDTDSAPSVRAVNEAFGGEIIYGTPYKTGKKYNGKDVYRLVKNLGNLPSGVLSDQAISIGITNFTLVTMPKVMYSGITGGQTRYYPSPFIGSSNINTWIGEDGNAYVTTGTDRSSLQLIVDLEYTKTTD